MLSAIEIQEIQNSAFLTGVALQNLAVYCGMSRSSLIDRLASGTLPQETAEKVKEVLRTMQWMRKMAGVPIDWAQVAVCKPLLEQRLQEYRENSNPIPTYVYVLRLSSLNYFQCIRGGQIITTPNLQDAFMTESSELARQVVDALLKKFRTKAAYESFTNTVQRRANTMASDLASVGLERE